MRCDMCKGKKTIKGWGSIDGATCYKCDGTGVTSDEPGLIDELKEQRMLAETKAVEFERVESRYTQPEPAKRGRPAKAL